MFVIAPGNMHLLDLHTLVRRSLQIHPGMRRPESARFRSAIGQEGACSSDFLFDDVIIELQSSPLKGRAPNRALRMWG